MIYALYVFTFLNKIIVIFGFDIVGGIDFVNSSGIQTFFRIKKNCPNFFWAVFECKLLFCNIYVLSSIVSPDICAEVCRYKVYLSINDGGIKVDFFGSDLSQREISFWSKRYSLHRSVPIYINTKAIGDKANRNKSSVVYYLCRNIKSNAFAVFGSNCVIYCKRYFCAILCCDYGLSISGPFYISA